MKTLLLAALLLVLSVPAAAADKWTQVQSRNFKLVGNATEREIREVAEGLELFRTVYARFFKKVKDGSSVATTVVVFKSDQSFKPFKPLYQGKPANIAGYFQPGEDVNYIVLAADMQTPRVIYHEYVHRLMSDNLGNLPPWFQEGFAEAFSTMEIEGRDKKVRLGRAIAEHVELLNERRFMPLEKLFSVEHGSPEYSEESKQGLFYAESWAFVHYMMFNDAERRAQFLVFLDALNQGKPATAAFQETFKVDLNAFQKTFEAYIQQRTAWNAFELKTPEGLDRNKEMTARVMTEAEAEFSLGDMLLHLRRMPEAETHLAKAVQLDPKLGAAQASMGSLLMINKKDSEALEYLRRATTLDPGNYLSHYYYATLLNKPNASEADWATMRSELQKTIELAPQFVEAMERLASANLTRNTDMPQTVDLLVKAISLSPGRDYLILQLAYALSRTQRRQEAQLFARGLLGMPTLELRLRQNAEELLAFLDRSAAAEALNESMRRGTTRPPAADSTPVNSANSDNPPVALRRTPRPEPDVVVNEPLRTDIQVVAGGATLSSGTARVTGLLTLLDCKDGLTLSLVVDGKTQKLHTANPTAIKFTSINSTVVKQIACGPAPGNGVPATIVYRPTPGADNLGEPLTVDFIESLAPVPLGLPGVTTLRGLLTKLDCNNGVLMTVVSAGKTIQFRTDSASKVAFLKGPNPDGTVTCGTMPGNGLAVEVVYRPGNAGTVLGEPVVVTFLK